jgi:hypothetical protein
MDKDLIVLSTIIIMNFTTHVEKSIIIFVVISPGVHLGTITEIRLTNV